MTRGFGKFGEWPQSLWQVFDDQSVCNTDNGAVSAQEDSVSTESPSTGEFFGQILSLVFCRIK